jgi:hypothetical protein
LHLVHPISPDYCKNLIGLPICAVKHDGTHLYGMLSRVDGGKIVLNEEAGDAPLLASEARAGKRGAAKKKKNKADSAQQKTVHTREHERDPYDNPFVPEGFFGPRVTLDLGSVAHLFVLMI